MEKVKCVLTQEWPDFGDDEDIGEYLYERKVRYDISSSQSGRHGRHYIHYNTEITTEDLLAIILSFPTVTVKKL